MGSIIARLAILVNLRYFVKQFVKEDDRRGEFLRLDGSEVILVNLQRSDLRFQGRGRNAQLGCRTRRPRYSASGLSQGSLNYLPLLRYRPLGQGLARRLCQNRLRRQPTLLYREGLRITDDDRPLDDILELSNVTRPRVRLQQLQCLLVDATYFLPHFAGIAFNEVLHQHENVFSSFAQRRNLDGKHV